MSISHIHTLKEETVYPNTVIDKWFQFLPNQANGDCLFESMSQLIFQSVDQSKSLRKAVFQYYELFDESKEYPVRSIEEKIQLTLLADPYDDSGELHKKKIAEDNVFANLGDIFVLTNICHCNILLLKHEGNSYRVIPIRNEKYSVFYHIRMIADEHFEACLPIQKNHPTRQKKKTKKTKKMQTRKKKLF